MASAVIGEWNYCPDGVGVFEIMPGVSAWDSRRSLSQMGKQLRQADFQAVNDRWLIDGGISDYVFRYQTPRREKMRLTMDSPKSPIVIKFVNAKTIDQLIDFIGSYGLPEAVGDEMTTNTVSNMQRGMSLLFNAYSMGRIPDSVIAFEAILPNLKIRPDLSISSSSNNVIMRMRCEDLGGFMTMELATILAGHIQVLICEHCKNFFTAGVGGARKKTAHYCSNKCRVAAQRAAAKAKEESAGQQSKEQKGT